MKFIVTGGNGFLGHHVVHELEGAGHDVVSLDMHAGPRQKQVLVDLGAVKVEQLRSVLPDADWIVHLASMVNFDSEFNAALFETNVLGTLKIAELAHERNTKLVFISSVAVHQSINSQLGVATPISPSQPYGLSKWLGEQILDCLDIPCTIIRLAGIIGANGPAHLRLNTAIREAATKRIVPTVTGKGTAMRNYIFVKDVALAIRAISEKNIGGVHYYGGPEPIPITDMARQICEVFLHKQELQFHDGEEARDQLVEVSAQLPVPRTFRRALEDMKIDYDANSISF